MHVIIKMLTGAYYGKFQTTTKCITCLIEKWHQMCTAFVCVVLFKKFLMETKTQKLCKRVHEDINTLIDINFDENS